MLADLHSLQAYSSAGCIFADDRDNFVLGAEKVQGFEVENEFYWKYVTFSATLDDVIEFSSLVASDQKCCNVFQGLPFCTFWLSDLPCMEASDRSHNSDVI